MYLIKKPNELKDDGTTTTNIPFMITYDGRHVYTGFSDMETAEYLIWAVRLDPEYRVIPLEEIDPDVLVDADHAMVFSKEVQIDRLLSGKLTRSAFERNLQRLR